MSVFETVGFILAVLFAFLLLLHITIFVGVMTLSQAQELLRRRQRKHLASP